MAVLKFADRVAESTVYVGSGDIPLAGAIDTDHDTFGNQFADGEEMPVSVFGGGKWMTFRGRYNSGANSLTRVTFRDSSTGSNLALSGTMTVMCGWGAADAAAMIRTDEAQALTAAQKAQGRGNLDVLKKNYIINGAMMVSQENGTTAVTAAAGYPVDQFFVGGGVTSGAWSAAQVASATPGGSPNRLRFTVTAADASVGAADTMNIVQSIEGFRVADLRAGSASAKTITIQFGVKAPAGTYCVTVRNNAANRCYVAEYTISGGEANTDVLKSVTFALDTAGTWLTDTGIGLQIFWQLMAGSTFQTAAGSWTAGNFLGTSSQFNIMGTNGNVFELFDVSLTEGSAAPAFQVPDFASELLVCQRYWEKSYPYGTAVGTGTLTGASAVYNSGSGTVWGTDIFYNAYKRGFATVTAYSPATGAAGFWRDSNSSLDQTFNLLQASQHGFSGYIVTTSGFQRLQGHWTANSRM